MKKISSKKGFTLMEMLIVVAIIAVLVAIAIPTFSSSLTKAKQAADNANVRAAYAEATTKMLTDGADEGAKTCTVSAGKMQADCDGSKIGSIQTTAKQWTAGKTVSVVVDEKGSATLSIS